MKLTIAFGVRSLSAIRFLPDGYTCRDTRHLKSGSLLMPMDSLAERVMRRIASSTSKSMFKTTAIIFTARIAVFASHATVCSLRRN
jgi:hypothetical protein